MISTFHAVREYLTPVLKSSQLFEKGVLTPEEFVAAGDQLVFKCPTWSWQAGEVAGRKSYLPAGKQFLIIRGVPSRERVADLDANTLRELSLEGEGEEEEADGWVATCAPEASLFPSASGAHSGVAGRGSSESVDDDGSDDISSTPAAGAGAGAGASGGPPTRAAPPPTILGAAVLEDHVGGGLGADTAAATTHTGEGAMGGAAAGAGASGGRGADDDDEEYADMSSFEEADLRVDEATVVASAPAAASSSSSGLVAVEEDNVVRSRTYDIHVTYDKYYQTPRVFLFGYDERKRPLSTEQVFEDIMRDYAHRTVTMEQHPHMPSGGAFASVHPCRHAQVMKKLLGQLQTGGREVRVDQYLFIFLKFLQSIVPTLSYDNTMDIDM